MPPEKDIFRVFSVVSCFIISVVRNNQIEQYFCRKLHLNFGEVQKKFYLHISNIFVKNTKTLKTLLAVVCSGGVRVWLPKAQINSV